MELAEATRISISTLSRLESGRRRPTLELLLPLAQTHQVPLDELVGAPPVGDPRIDPEPFTRNGMTFVPLTRNAGATPVEILSLFGAQGERMHVRAKPADRPPRRASG